MTHQWKFCPTCGADLGEQPLTASIIGRRGGLARKQKQTAAQLSAQGKKAARARWNKKEKAE